MKKVICILGLSLSFIAAACSSKGGSAKEISNITGMDSVDADGLQRMQVSTVETRINFKDKEYRSVVSRMPDETLPHVTNDMGDIYVDNKITLKLTRSGETVLNKKFTKADFASVVELDFLKKSILEGLVFDKTTSHGIVYAASVCYPQTDLYVPLSIIVTPDGKMSIERVESLEEAYNEKRENNGIISR